jgi:poly(A) polymerase
MRAFGLPPSRMIGDIKRSLEGSIDKGEIPAAQDAEFYIDLLRKEPDRFGLK